MNAVEMLDKLAELQAQRTLIELDKQKAVESVMTPEIKQQLADIEAEFATKYEGVDANIAELEAQIKDAVIENGASVKGSFLHAVYSKGRVSWDSRKLEGLMMVIPQLAEARKEGDPSVAIRKI
ncbi:MAG: hypothetical protein ACYC36_13295 [Bellilinea sp.]